MWTLITHAGNLFASVKSVMSRELLLLSGRGGVR